MKWKTIITIGIVMCLILPMVLSYTQVEYSKDNATWKEVTNTTQNYTIIEELDNGIDEGQDYYFRIREVYEDGTSNWAYISTETKNAVEERNMAYIAITLFVLAICIGLVVLPFKKRFARNEVLNRILSRACWTLAIWLMMMNAAIMATFAEASSLDLQSEMFRYMWLFGWAGYVFTAYFVLMSIFDYLRMWRFNKQKERHGKDFDEEEDGN